MVIRSVTGYIGRPREWSRDELRSLIEKSISYVEEAARELSRKYSIFTKRLSLPQPPPSLYSRLVDIVSDIVPSNYLVSVGVYLLEKTSVQNIVDVVSSGFYVGIVWNKIPDFSKVAEIFYRVASLKPVYATRIAFSLDGAPIETPYFPLTTSLYGFGVGISLLYPRYLARVFNKRGLRGIRKALQSIDSELLELLKPVKTRVSIDYSISPWMEDSVVDLIESITGYTLSSPGFLYGVYILNSILKEFTRAKPHTEGYNEVMLPYIEDSRLLDAGEKGAIRARDFLLFSSVCVAGPDTIVLKYDRSGLVAYIKSAYSIAWAKRRHMALRIIPVDDEPGSRIYIDRFGGATVLDY